MPPAPADDKIPLEYIEMRAKETLWTSRDTARVPTYMPPPCIRTHDVLKESARSRRGNRKHVCARTQARGDAKQTTGYAHCAQNDAGACTW